MIGPLTKQSWRVGIRIVFSLLAVLGAAIVYTVLMSTFLYNTGSYFIGMKYELTNEYQPVFCSVGGNQLETGKLREGDNPAGPNGQAHCPGKQYLVS